MSDFDSFPGLAEASAGALAHLNSTLAGDNPTLPSGTSDNPSTTPASSTSQGSTAPASSSLGSPAPADQAAQQQQPANQPPQPKQLADDDLVIDPADGQAKPWKQVKTERLMHADYTRKTQETAAQRKQFEAQLQQAQAYEQERQNLEKYFSNPQAQLNFLVQNYGPQAVAQYLQQLSQSQQPSYNPDEIPNLGQVHQTAAQVAETKVQALQQQLASVQNELKTFTTESVNKAIQDDRDLREYTQHRQFFDGELNKVLTEFPDLKEADEYAEDKLRFKVMQRKPQTPEQASQFLKEAAKAEVSRLDKLYEKRQKAALAKSSQLVSNGIEPPGGSGIQPAPRTDFLRKDGATDWKGISDAATAYIQNKQRQR